MMRTEEWKYVHRYPDGFDDSTELAEVLSSAEGPHELYDLANDPDERTNLADDPNQTERIGDLKQRLEDWYERYVVPERDGRNFAVTGTGQLRPVGGQWENPATSKNQPFAQE